MIFKEIFACWWLFLIQRWTPEILTLFSTIYDVPVSCNRFSKVEMRQCRPSGTERLVKNLQPNWKFLSLNSLLQIVFQFEHNTKCEFNKEEFRQHQVVLPKLTHPARVDTKLIATSVRHYLRGLDSWKIELVMNFHFIFVSFGFASALGPSKETIQLRLTQN